MNDKLTELIKHKIDCAFYGNTLSEKTKERVQQLYSEIYALLKHSAYISSKNKLEELLEELENLLKNYRIDYKKFLREEIKNISETESEWLKDFLIGLGISVAIPTTLLQSVKLSPIASQTDYVNLVDNISNSIKSAVTVSLKNAYITKEPVETVVSRIEKKQTSIEKTVISETETFNTTAFEMTDYLIYKANNQKVRYCAMLDSNTCSLCASYDGEEFESGKAPYLPQHERCRCTLTPSAIIEDEMPTYTEWFETLDEDKKKNILGKGRYELYQQGFTLDRFVSDGKTLTLEELRKN